MTEMGPDGEDPHPETVFRNSRLWHADCYTIHMKSKTLYYCPQDPDMLMFEDIFDEGIDFFYQPLQESPRVCPKCGHVLFKSDCDVIEELFASLDPDDADPAPACRTAP